MCIINNFVLKKKTKQVTCGLPSIATTLILIFLTLAVNRVKLAYDLKTKREVAIKILKVKAGRATEFSKH